MSQFDDEYAQALGAFTGDLFERGRIEGRAEACGELQDRLGNDPGHGRSNPSTNTVDAVYTWVTERERSASANALECAWRHIWDKRDEDDWDISDAIEWMRGESKRLRTSAADGSRPADAIASDCANERCGHGEGECWDDPARTPAVEPKVDRPKTYVVDLAKALERAMLPRERREPAPTTQPGSAVCPACRRIATHDPDCLRVAMPPAAPPEPAEPKRTIWDLAERVAAEVDAWPEWKRRAADQALVTQPGSAVCPACRRIATHDPDCLRVAMPEPASTAEPPAAPPSEPATWFCSDCRTATAGESDEPTVCTHCGYDRRCDDAPPAAPEEDRTPAEPQRPPTDEQSFWNDARAAQAEVDSWPQWKRDACARALVTQPASEPPAHPMEVWDRYDSAHGPGGTPAEPQRPDDDRSALPEEEDHIASDDTGRVYCELCEERLVPPGTAVPHASDCVLARLATARARIVQLESWLRIYEDDGNAALAAAERDAALTRADEHEADYEQCATELEAMEQRLIAEQTANTELRTRAEAAETVVVKEARKVLALDHDRADMQHERDRAQALLAQTVPYIVAYGNADRKCDTLLAAIRSELDTK